MNSIFFEPWIGDLYKKGINGKKVFILGDSHYCPHDGNNGDECEFFCLCTSVDEKNSSNYKTRCNFLDNIKDYYPDEVYSKGLSLTTKTEVKSFLDGNINRSFNILSKYMTKFFNIEKETFWEHIAFGNFIQFFLPNHKTSKEFYSQRDIDSLKNTLLLLEKPDIIIVLGKHMNYILSELYPSNKKEDFLINCKSEDGKYDNYNDKYLLSINIDNHSYTVLNSYHPAYENNSRGKYKFDDYGKLDFYMNYLFSKEVSLR